MLSRLCTETMRPGGGGVRSVGTLMNRRAVLTAHGQVCSAAFLLDTHHPAPVVSTWCVMPAGQACCRRDVTTPGHSPLDTVSTRRDEGVVMTTNDVHSNIYWHDPVLNYQTVLPQQLPLSASRKSFSSALQWWS